jgi:glycosyltransferase involved in cell wall biosynthesis
MTNISIIILTKNEQQDLPGCLNSVAWSDDIHVYDSLSDDDTVTIAEKFGAKVTRREFDDWASHQNWGLRNLPFKHKWVYYCDADERVTYELMLAIQAAVNDPQDNVAFRIKRRDYFMGQWLKHVTPSPFNIRLFKPEAIRYERLVNPITIVNGPIGEINEHFDHFPFSKGISHWIKKHNEYSGFEAKIIIHDKLANNAYSLKKALFSKDINERRFHQKKLYYKVPFRPVFMFIILYILKRGFLDGRAGLTYSVLRAIYEFFIELKVKELSSVFIPYQKK